MQTIRARLKKALRAKTLVRFFSRFNEGSVSGYVVGVGPEFFILALIGEGICLNGFQCFRLKDVRRLQVPHKYARFYEAALRKRRQLVPRRPRVLLRSVEQLLKSASTVFPLVTIHREQAAPEVCHIGRIISTGKGSVSLLEIGPDAIWDEKPESYQLKEITRIDFGGGYEESLHLVGGSPTSSTRPRKRLPL